MVSDNREKFRFSHDTEEIIGGRFNVEEPALDELKEWLKKPELFAKFGHKFKEEFGKIVVERRMSPAEFEDLTSVWNDLFDGEPLPDSRK